MKPRDDRKYRETASKLEAAGQQRLSPEHKDEVIEGICTSMASFIAGIDGDSRNVASYIKQRLGALLRHVPLDELEACGHDGRQLARPTDPVPSQRRAGPGVAPNPGDPR